MMGDLSGPEELIEKTLGPINGEIHASSMPGEPVEREGQLMIPVYRISVAGFYVEMPSRATYHISRLPLFDREPKVKRKLAGHIVVEPTGVRWRPRLNIAKLFAGLLPGVVSLLLLVRKMRD